MTCLLSSFRADLRPSASGWASVASAVPDRRRSTMLSKYRKALLRGNRSTLVDFLQKRQVNKEWRKAGKVGHCASCFPAFLRVSVFVRPVDSERLLGASR